MTSHPASCNKKRPPNDQVTVSSVWQAYKSHFISKAQSQGGSLGSLFGKVTAPVTKEVAKKLLPALGMAAVYWGNLQCNT